MSPRMISAVALLSELEYCEKIYLSFWPMRVNCKGLLYSLVPSTFFRRKSQTPLYFSYAMDLHILSLKRFFVMPRIPWTYIVLFSSAVILMAVSVHAASAQCDYALDGLCRTRQPMKLQRLARRLVNDLGMAEISVQEVTLALVIAAASAAYALSRA
ncbi:hypothetical protein DL89DRAFT_12349 [Linderina pennispora]|uniref:Uncharacterized protein n=1 Tax=Linderina pennispora TaxID=61395 RepID=A0A1Y1WKY2_9FUNG|nr:uncharacterized protein DL89DRAFT_12349 [Linderina pennispora]ORX74241.1 hypothetical protein DL89DRAFT_12349 [Linderina pennispora]